MIIHRYFLRETARNTAAITLVLAVVIVFLGLTGLLARAARGEIAEDIVVVLLGLQLVKRLDLLLILGLYLGMLLTAARWYRDSEMTVLAACGVGLNQLLRPALIAAGVVAAAVTVLAFHFTPWAAQAGERVKSERQHQSDVSGVAPGVFNEARNRERVFYAEGVDPETGVLSGVFVSGLERGKQGVVLARRGHTYTDKRTGDRFLALSEGTLHEGAPGEAGYRILKFEMLHLRLEAKAYEEPPPAADGMTTAALLRTATREASAEWHWRIAKPLLAAVLALYALVLAHTDPRRGRLSNLFAAILVYFIYSNLIALGQTLIKKGQVPGAIGLWWVHLGMLAVALYLLNRRAANRPLLAWRRGA